jgi:hypothetical protein
LPVVKSLNFKIDNKSKFISHLNNDVAKIYTWMKARKFFDFSRSELHLIYPTIIRHDSKHSFEMLNFEGYSFTIFENY